MTPSVAALVRELEDGLAVGQGHLLAYVVNEWGNPNDVPDTIRRDMAVVSKARTALPALLDALEAGERDVMEWLGHAQSLLAERDAALALAERRLTALIGLTGCVHGDEQTCGCRERAYAEIRAADPAVAALPRGEVIAPRYGDERGEGHWGPPKPAE